jgi:hypothetical protein
LGASQVLSKPVEEEILAALLSQEKEQLASRSGS